MSGYASFKQVQSATYHLQVEAVDMLATIALRTLDLPSKPGHSMVIEHDVRDLRR